jgi:DNA end-binding protein Ku
MKSPIRTAPEPTRASGSFTLSWGMLSVPLSVYTGTQGSAVTRKEFVDGDPKRPAGRAVIDKTTGEVIPSERVARMAQADTGEWVTLSDDEIKDCTLEKGLATVIAFVPNDSVGAFVAEDLAQVRPQKTKGVMNPGARKAFSLLLAAMKAANVSALVKFSVRGPARHGLVTMNGDLIYVKSADQVRAEIHFDRAELAPEELELAMKLIEVCGIWVPTVLDDTAPKVQALVNSKASGAVFPPPKPESMAAPDNLLGALVASLEAAKGSAVA